MLDVGLFVYIAADAFEPPDDVLEPLPCGKPTGWDAADSFVTHQRSLENLRRTRAEGMGRFLQQQQAQMEVLRTLLAGFDEGRPYVAMRILGGSGL